jgi:indole-3-glycerol phosphate synthase
MCDVDDLKKMLDCAFEHGLFVLLESFDDADLELTAQLLEQPQYLDQAERNKLLAGVNTRNLRSLAVDPDRLQRLSPSLPPSSVCVAESGLHTAGDAAAVARWGYRMALVGTALMRADDPARLIADMLSAGRNA